MTKKWSCLPAIHLLSAGIGRRSLKKLGEFGKAGRKKTLWRTRRKCNLQIEEQERSREREEKQV